MNSKQALEQRLQGLAVSLAVRPEALALLGLGSAGLENERLDEWSDLDFFVVVAAGSKQAWLQDTSWLGAPQALAYLFRNTPDGFKVLWQDGIFGEMAVFEPQELATIPFAEGRMVWARPGFDTLVLKPGNTGGRKSPPPSAEHATGELLTCLYVGMCRWRRGEKLSAWRFIQGYCLDRFLELTELLESARPGYEDPYSRDRRFEQRFPAAAENLQGFLTGYTQVPQSALAFLAWLEARMPVNAAMAAEIRQLCADS
ncbi:MAG: hypothetical protein KKI09_01220 [Spirochaetes bacterium]|nr:hypothetical protein [Spirochaetota bacterium]MBU0954022.1 hypothetical protein [Spirochaetota bacterium]